MMTQITTQAPVDAFVGEAAELTMSPAGLAILAKVGLICGPCKSVDVRTQGRLAIVRVDPRNKRDPIIPIPMIKATPEAWAALRAYFQAVMRCVGYSRLSQDDPAALHAEAVAMIPQVVSHFVGYLDPIELKRFEQWLGVALLGEAQVRGIT
jgi:hypothetical protein